MELKDSLKNLGLTDKEALVYLALLQLGRASAHSIADKSGLKRPTTYVILEELMKKGLVARVPREKKQLYVPKSPEEVIGLAEEKLFLAKKALPELLALAKSGKKSDVKVTYYEGEKQVTDAYFGLLAKPDATIEGWISDAPHKQRREFWYSEFRTKRLAQNIRNRLIVPNTPMMQEYAADDASSLKETRIERNPAFVIACEINMYDGNKVVMTSWEETVGVVIESRRIHDTLKAIFETHWKSLETKK